MQFQSNISLWQQHQKHSFVRFEPHSFPNVTDSSPEIAAGAFGGVWGWLSNF
jgi:hypothetical protein